MCEVHCQHEYSVSCFNLHVVGGSFRVLYVKRNFLLDPQQHIFLSLSTLYEDTFWKTSCHQIFLHVVT